MFHRGEHEFVISVLPVEIHTQRLVLRQPSVSDAEPIFNGYAQDAQVTHFLMWRPNQSLAETVQFISQCIESWSSGQCRPYAISETRDATIPIGMIEARRTAHGLDLGYVLRRSLWGRGLMAEAIRALSDAALSDPSIYRVQAFCDIENAASARALEKAGFLREAQMARYAVLPNIGPDPRTCYLYAKCK